MVLDVDYPVLLVGPVVELRCVNEHGEEQEAEAPEEHDELHLSRALDNEANLLALSDNQLVKVDAENVEGEAVEDGHDGLVQEKNTKNVHRKRRDQHEHQKYGVHQIHDSIVDLGRVLVHVHEDRVSVKKPEVEEVRAGTCIVKHAQVSEHLYALIYPKRSRRLV